MTPRDPLAYPPSQKERELAHRASPINVGSRRRLRVQRDDYGDTPATVIDPALTSDEVTDLPIRPVQAWADGRGNLYPTKEAALLVEIERVLGHFGTGESMAPGIARLIATKRHQLMPLLDAFGPAETIEAIPLQATRDKRAG